MDYGVGSLRCVRRCRCCQQRPSFIGWLSWAVFFGIFALLVVGFMPKAEEPVWLFRRAPNQLNGQKAKCPLCAEMIKVRPLVRKHCGCDVEPAMAYNLPKKKKTRSRCSTNSHCGGVVGPVINRCQYCERDTGY